MGTSASAPSLCSKFHVASELIGRRWTGAIIYVLLRSRCRFATLRSAIPDITDRMLSDRLQELEQEGIVERTVIPETPVRVEYALTKKGRALANAMDAIAEWAEKWVTVPAAAPEPLRPRRRGPGERSGRRQSATHEVSR
jgi:DNA-binding HxlR family transcriptional regulator